MRRSGFREVAGSLRVHVVTTLITPSNHAMMMDARISPASPVGISGAQDLVVENGKSDDLP